MQRAASIVAAVTLMLALESIIGAQEAVDKPPSSTEQPAPPQVEKKPKIVDYGGGVTVIPDERTIVLKGRTCVAGNEALEWAIVLSRGKEYESVIAVDADASVIQFALIALGYNAGGGVETLGDPRTPVGDPVIIEVEWIEQQAAPGSIDSFASMAGVERPGETAHSGTGAPQAAKTRRCRLEELVWNAPEGAPMEPTPFIFTGSRMTTDPETNKIIFLASSEHLVAALYRDPAAILNNPLKTGADDIFYVANRRTLPPRGTPVTVYLKPVPKPPEPASSESAETPLAKPVAAGEKHAVASDKPAALQGGPQP
jgi:hypothetical protein